MEKVIVFNYFLFVVCLKFLVYLFYIMRMILEIFENWNSKIIEIRIKYGMNMSLKRMTYIWFKLQKDGIRVEKVI